MSKMDLIVTDVLRSITVPLCSNVLCTHQSRWCWIYFTSVAYSI